MTLTETKVEERRKRGRKPHDAGGRRDRRAGTTLNDPERDQHHAWLRTQGWPEVPEGDIVRNVLIEQWRKAGIRPAT